MSFNPKVAVYSGRTQGVPYTPPSVAVNAGDVIIIGGLPHFAEADIPVLTLGSVVFSGAAWKGNKSSGAWTIGDGIYWNPTGTPNVGTASTGAFNNSGVGYFCGYCIPTPGTTAGALTADQLGYFVKGERGGLAQASSVAATGSVVGDAAALNFGFNFVSAADATKGVILPAGAVGRIVYVKNSDAANAVLKVYPPTSGTINALSANAAISLAAKVSAIFICLDGTAWYTIPLLPS